MSEEYSEYLLEEMKKRGWSQSELARRADLSPGTIGNIISENREPGYGAIEKISAALGVSIETGMAKAGRLGDVKARELRTKDLVYRASLLDARQLDELLQYADFIRERDKK